MCVCGRETCNGECGTLCGLDLFNFLNCAHETALRNGTEFTDRVHGPVSPPSGGRSKDSPTCAREGGRGVVVFFLAFCWGLQALVSLVSTALFSLVSMRKDSYFLNPEP